MNYLTKKFLIPVALLAIAAVIFLCTRQDGGAPALAMVNGTSISEADFRYWWGRSGQGEDTPQRREALLDRLIEREALVQQAAEAGLADELDFQEQVRSLLISRLLEQQLQPQIANIEIDEETLRTLHEQQGEEKSGRAVQWQVAVLWFNSRGQAPLEARYHQRLSEVRDRMKTSTLPIAEGFGGHARTDSEHMESRYRGGRIEPLQPGANYDPWRQAVLDAASGLQAGEMSEVVVGQHGVFLVRLLEKLKPEAVPFEALRDRLASDHRRTLREQVKAEFHNSIVQEAAVEKFPPALNALAPLTQPSPATAQHSPR